MTTAMTCPCDTGKTFNECCNRFLSGARFATTAEELMRSRYSAFVTGNAAYLRSSWHPRTCPVDVSFVDDQEWTGLTIVNTTKGQMLDQEGTVEFVARFVRNRRSGELHENSLFERLDGRWLYVDDADQ